MSVYEIKAVFRSDSDNVVSYALNDIPDGLASKSPDFIGVYRAKLDGHQLNIADFYGADAEKFASVFVNALRLEG